MWDYNILNIAKHPTNNSMKVTYKSKDASLPDYFEEISFSYFQNEQIFYIIESINSPTLSKSERVWTFEQVVNRPYLMRVTMHWTVTPQYHRVKGEGTFIIKGLAGLKNYIQQADKETEMSITVSNMEEQKEKENMKLTINTGGMIHNALDLIEEDTNMQGSTSMADQSSDDEQIRQSIV